ncbi:MAG TPA: hypothetical protein VN667_22130, partial [Burkholderiales bacterium]|nr:hypothetical protein [Burkholderiales bacterium]
MQTAQTVLPPRADPQTVGALLRTWRQRRRLSQLDFALEADISARHLSFVETGRALADARRAIDVVDAQKPFPAFALDRHWNVAASNSALQELYEGVDAQLMARPVNGLRLTPASPGNGPAHFQPRRVARASP